MAWHADAAGQMKSKARTTRKPPIQILQARVDQYAIRDRSFKFRGHRLLFSDDKEVGPVPRLALAHGGRGDILLVHCDRRWNVIGFSGHPTMREAKADAERFYPGISKAWKRTGYTRTQARRALARLPNPRCAICRKFWHEVQEIVEVKKARLVLCDVCIRELYASLE